MAKIHVGRTRLSNRRLEDALRACKVGDELLMHEGTYRLESFNLNGIHLTGVGDPAKVQIEARLDVWAESRITGLTLRAPHFGNAVYLRNERARIDLTRCTVHGDPAKKYPTVYGDGGTIVLSESAVHAPVETFGVHLAQTGYVHATSSHLDSLRLTGGRAVLTDVSTRTVSGLRGARIETYHDLTVRPEPGYHALALDEESVATIPRLHLPDSSATALCTDSFLQIDDLRAPDGVGMTVTVKGRAVVEARPEAITVHDPDAPPVPKVVTWRLADAHAFTTAVQPHLNIGDTVQLEAGEYHLDDCEDGNLGIACHLVGAGADRTVVHGSLTVIDGRDATLRDLEVVAPPEHNAVLCRTGASLEMTGVRVTSTSEKFPGVFLASGTTTMRDCTIAVPEDSPAGITYVSRDAQLSATSSALGWVAVQSGGAATLRDCGSFQLAASGGSTITSHGGHDIRRNTLRLRHVIVEDDATISLEHLTTDAPDFEVFAEGSSLRIDDLVVPDDADPQAFVSDGARIEVGGAPVTTTDLDAPVEAQASAGRPVPADEAVGEDGEGGADGEGGESATPTGPAGANPEDDDPLATIESLTGLTKVKEQIRKFTRMVQYNQLRRDQGKTSSPVVMHSLFLGNPGTGKTTVARLLGRALHQAGAIPTDTFVEVTGRADLVGDTIGSSARLTTAVLESARGGVLFVDEAYSLYKPQANEFAQEAVDTILTFMENHRDEIVVVFAGYGAEMQDFIGMNPGLRSRVKNRFDFEDYTPAEVAEIGYRALVDGDHSVNEALYRQVVAREYERASDHSNGRWVRNFNEDLVAVLAERVLSSPAGTDISHITDEDLHTLTGGTSDDKEARVEQLLAELDGMIGLAPVKEWVRRLVNQVKVDTRRAQRDGVDSRPTYHMVFAGSQGTGKTTVARIVAELFHNLGILHNPDVTEVSPTTISGQYIGHTERNMTQAIDRSLGGVLFVDEAHDFIGSSENDFGPKAVATLLPRLENDRTRFVAIFAGYTEPMRRFLDTNPGLPSRVPHWVEFPDYTPEEIGRIVVAILARRWTLDHEHLARVATTTYASLPERERANGRWARNFAERVEAEHNEYVATHDVADEALDVVPTEVVDAAAAAFGG